MKKYYMKHKKILVLCLLLTFIAPVCNVAINANDRSSEVPGIETYDDFPAAIE